MDLATIDDEDTKPLFESIEEPFRVWSTDSCEVMSEEDQELFYVAGYCEIDEILTCDVLTSE